MMFQWGHTWVQRFGNGTRSSASAIGSGERAKLHNIGQTPDVIEKLPPLRSELRRLGHEERMIFGSPTAIRSAVNDMIGIGPPG